MINLDTYIISDTHFGHDNIIKFCNRPTNHDELMRERWLATVRPEDTILHLGDVGFGKMAAVYLADLPGRKLLIKGNHDKKTDSYYEAFGFEIMKPFTIYEGEFYSWDSESYDGVGSSDRPIRFVHDPADVAPDDRAVIIHGHIHNNGYPPECPEDIDYRNVSVEVMSYTPIKLRQILYSGIYQSRKAAGINPYYLEKK